MQLSAMSRVDAIAFSSLIFLCVRKPSITMTKCLTFSLVLCFGEHFQGVCQV